MTKVCHVISGYFRQDPRIFYRLCSTLVDNGFSVTILTNDGDVDEIINSIKITSCKKVRKNTLMRLLFSPLIL